MLDDIFFVMFLVAGTLFIYMFRKARANPQDPETDWGCGAVVWFILAIVFLGLTSAFYDEGPRLGDIFFAMFLVTLTTFIFGFSRANRWAPDRDRGFTKRDWGFITLSSFILVIVFLGLFSAFYEGPRTERASSSSEPVEEAEQQSPATESKQATEVQEVDLPEAEKQKAPIEKAEKKAADKENEQREYDATVRVTRVVDGDTIRISPTADGNNEVRLIGVDTPETKEPGCEVQPYGPEASEFATSELQGEEVGRHHASTVRVLEARTAGVGQGAVTGTIKNCRLFL